MCPADDMTDPAVSAIFSHLDTMVVLSRNQAAKGIYPAVDPLKSSSKMMDRHFLGERHYRVAETVREHLARYHELEDIIAMLGIESLSRGPVASSPAPDDCSATSPSRFMSSPSTPASPALGAARPDPRRLRSLPAGDYDQLAEADCCMRGSMQESRE